MKRLLLISFLFLSACTNPEEATKALEAMDLKPVAVGGMGHYLCGEDPSATLFKAKTRAGKYVTGSVCAGWFFKGYTIRFGRILNEDIWEPKYRIPPNDTKDGQ